MTIVWLALLHYYTKVSGFVAYFGIGLRRIRLSWMDLLCVCALSILFCLQLYIKSLSDILIDFRFFWGWVVFYLIFKPRPPSAASLTRALVVLSVMTLVEAVAINTVVHAQQLPNFPSADALAHFAAVGSYQRPYSFGARATVSSSLLVALMAFCRVRGWRFWLSLTAVLAFVSGTGMFCLLFLIAVRYRALFWKAVLPVTLIALAGVTLYTNIGHAVIAAFEDKTGTTYLTYLIAFKWNQITQVYDIATPLMMFIGLSGERLAEVGRGGDFGLLSFVAVNGLVGPLLLTAMVWSRLNRNNRLALFVVVVSTLHYPVMFFIPGQMLVGLLLAVRNTSFRQTSRLSHEHALLPAAQAAV